jgi:hypothetical protein
LAAAELHPAAADVAALGEVLARRPEAVLPGRARVRRRGILRPGQVRAIEVDAPTDGSPLT